MVAKYDKTVRNGIALLREIGGARLSRRDLLKLGVVATGSGAVTIKTLIGRPVEAALPPSPPTTPFVDLLPVQVPLAPTSLDPAPTGNRGSGECGRNTHQAWSKYPPQKFYALNMAEGDHEFHSDITRRLGLSRIWGFNAQFPGPLFHSRYGEPLLVRVYNSLPSNLPGFGTPEISTHLHNAHTPSESDGFPTDWFSASKNGPTLSGPGAFRDHHYPMIYAGADPREALGTLWYHDHTEDFTAPNVVRGMAGFHLFFDHIDSGDETDTSATALRLPSGAYDVPLLLMDVQLDEGGQVVFDSFGNDGMLGDKFTVNGKIQPRFEVEPRKYRLRLLNAGPSRYYELWLMVVDSNNFVPFTFHIANDGNLLPSPIAGVQSIRLAVAERADVVVDFSKFKGKQLYLVNRLRQTNGRGPENTLLSPGTPLMRIDVKSRLSSGVTDDSRVPNRLRALPPLGIQRSVATRNFDFNRNAGFWTVNGRIFDSEIPLVTVKKGTVETWIFRNNSSTWSHPIHVHFEEGRIVGRNGQPPPLHEQGRKDVYNIGPGEVVEVVLKFRDFVGKYPCHCHNVVHEDHAMMFRWDIN